MATGVGVSAGVGVSTGVSVGSEVVGVSDSDEEQAAAMRTIPIQTNKNRTMHPSCSFPRLYIACLGMSLIINLLILKDSSRNHSKVPHHGHGAVIFQTGNTESPRKITGVYYGLEAETVELWSIDRRTI